jgi:hypothetical protein
MALRAFRVPRYPGMTQTLDFNCNVQSPQVFYLIITSTWADADIVGYRGVPKGHRNHLSFSVAGYAGPSLFPEAKFQTRTTPESLSPVRSGRHGGRVCVFIMIMIMPESLFVCSCFYPESVCVCLLLQDLVQSCLRGGGRGPVPGWLRASSAGGNSRNHD